MKTLSYLPLALLALATPVFRAQGEPTASEQKAVFAPVRQFANGFNHGDPKIALAACTDQVSIIDDFPPYAWRGAGACAQWLQDQVAFATKNGLTDQKVTLAKRRHVAITGKDAYVVVLANLSYQQMGKAMKQTGATLTFALHQGTSGWRITGWTWADP